MFNTKRIFLLLIVAVFLISGCGGNSGKTPGTSFALDMVKEHYREVINKEAIKFEDGGDGEFLEKEWYDDAGDYIEVYSKPSWVHINGDLPGQILRIKVATSWRRLKTWSYKGISIYMIKGTEELRAPDKIPTPPTPPGTIEELKPYILAYLEKKHPPKGKTSGEPTRLSLTLGNVNMLEAPKWLGPDEDYSYDTMRFEIPATYSYELVQFERMESQPIKHEISVKTIINFSANKPDAADWLKDNSVKEWSYFEDPDNRDVIKDEVSKVEVEVPELDLELVEKLLRDSITADGTYIKSMTFKEKKSRTNQMNFTWTYEFNLNYIEPHWNKKDAIQYLGTGEIEIKSFDGGLSWDFENSQKKVDEDKQVKYHSGGALKGLDKL